MFVYICQACLRGDHGHCEVHVGIPTEPHKPGGGKCICKHVVIGPKHKFEQYVYDRDMTAMNH